MNKFKDAAGRQWLLSANFGVYAKVRAVAGVNLADIGTESRKSLEQLSDPFTLGSVIWTMIEDQAATAGVSVDQFNAAVDGTVLYEAYNALIDEMIFFCHPSQRKVLGLVVERLRAAEAQATETLDKRAALVTQEIDDAISQLIQSNSAMNSQASSASTLATGPSENSAGPSEAGGESTGITLPPS